MFTVEGPRGQGFGISELPAQEKLEARAKRFGAAPLDDGVPRLFSGHH